VIDAFEEVGELSDADGTRQVLVAHQVDGYRHYGGVVIPPVKELKKLPVLVLCHPGDAGTSLTDQNWFFGLLGDPAIRRRFVQVIPSFRGEILDAGTLGRFRSEGPPSLFDRDADDALALLDCVLQSFPNADPSRVVSVGYSRGGQVAMRIAQRDPRILGVIDFCGMSDEWTINGQGYIRDFLEEERPEPAPSNFYYHVLWDLRRSTCDVWYARSLLLRSCIVYQAPRLPKLQVHHGALDGPVPIHEADRLVAVLATTPGANYEYFRYPNGDHGIQSLIGAWAHVEEFLGPFLN
jgi:dipeptidyl aminopeptidase/acylaminoacyl peptidase